MRILLTNQPKGESNIPTGKFELNRQPPISLCYIATGLINAGHKVKVLDVHNYNLSVEKAVKIIRRFSPDIVGVGLFSNTLRQSYEFTKKIKEFSEVILGGPHASACSEKVLEEFKHINFLLRGESEFTFTELCNALEKKPEKKLKTIKGLSYRANKRIIHNPDANVIGDLDKIPFPARHLLRKEYIKGMYYYALMNNDRTCEVIYLSRGCPSRCNFCYQMTPKYRFRSADNIIEEIKERYDMGIKSFQIQDDNFTLNEKKCIEVLDLIRKERMDLSLKLRSRVNSINRGLLKKMNKTGVKVIVYGFESGSQKMLNLMNKNTTVKMNIKACNLTKKYGIYPYADMLVGYPGEDYNTINETITFLKKTQPDAIAVALLCPFPKTYIYELSKKEGTLVNDWSIHNKPPWIKYGKIKDYKELCDMRTMLIKKFYSDPKIISNFIKRNLKNFNYKLIEILIKRKIAHMLNKIRIS